MVLCIIHDVVVIMKKNRFSKLLKSLMLKTGLKNYTLAQELKYDVSYISKWTSGHVIPPEKSSKVIIEGIAKCLVGMASEEVKNELVNDYEVYSYEELELAILENLELEYLYVRDLQKNTGQDVAQKLMFYPEISITKFIEKLRHPALRKVQALDIRAVFDMMAMAREHQLKITWVDNDLQKGRYYSNVHYSLVLNIQPNKWDYIADTIFLMNLLEDSNHVDFNIYADIQAIGKAVFAVKDEYAISGMLVDHNTCMSVILTEDVAASNTLFQQIKGFCSYENLIFHRKSMMNMLKKGEYIHSMLSLNQRWIIGHMTEHFLPENLFEEIVDSIEKTEESSVSVEYLRRIQHSRTKILNEDVIKILIHKLAFYNLVINKEIYFYNKKINLTTRQVQIYLDHFLDICNDNNNLQIKMVLDKMSTDYEFNRMQCVFINDSTSHIQLRSSMNNLLCIKRSDTREMFNRFFEELWNGSDDIVISDRSQLVSNIKNIIRGFYMFSDD